MNRVCICCKLIATVCNGLNSFHTYEIKESGDFAYTYESDDQRTEKFTGKVQCVSKGGSSYQLDFIFPNLTVRHFVNLEGNSAAFNGYYVQVQRPENGKVRSDFRKVANLPSSNSKNGVNNGQYSSLSNNSSSSQSVGGDTSDNGNDGASSSQTKKSKNRETTEGVPQCVKVGPDQYGHQVFTNVCNIRVSLYWCVDYECSSNNVRLVHLRANGGKYNVMAGEKEYFYAACPDPFLPNERPNGTFDGKHYSCEK